MSDALSVTRTRFRTPRTKVVVQEDVTLPTAFTLKLTLREYHHDMARVTVDRDLNLRTRFMAGQPIRVNYGRVREAQGSFVGYIHHVEPTGNETDRPRLQTIVALGASMRMKQQRMRTWEEVRASTVVRQIFTDHRLNSLSGITTRVHEQVLQSNESDWELAVRLSKEEGRTFYVRNTTGYFLPRTVQSELARKRAPLFRRNTHNPERNDIRDFNIFAGLDHRAGVSGRSREAHGVNPFTGAVFSVTDDGVNDEPLGAQQLEPFFHELDRSTVLDNSLEGTESVRARSGVHAFPVKAKATVKGDARVTQGTLVCFDGINDQCDGFWFVEAVTHEFRTDTEYDMELELGRSALRDDGSRPDEDADRITTHNGRRLAPRDQSRNALGEVVFHSPRSLFIPDPPKPVPTSVPWRRDPQIVRNRSWGDGGPVRFRRESARIVSAGVIVPPESAYSPTASNAATGTGRWVSEWVAPKEDVAPHEC